MYIPRAVFWWDICKGGEERRIAYQVIILVCCCAHSLSTFILPPDFYHSCMCGGCLGSAPLNDLYTSVSHIWRGICCQSSIGKINSEILTYFAKAFEMYNWVWCSTAHATQNCLKIWRPLQDVVKVFSQPNPWVVFLQAVGERRGDTVTAVSWLQFPACSCLSYKFVPSPAELNAAATALACRAALLPCQLCMSFVYIWFGRTFHDKNQGLQWLWTGGWLGWGAREKVCTNLLLVAH